MYTSGRSCAEILVSAPGCRGQSGQYWIENATAHAVEVYCEMATLGGGWERIALFNASATVSCPEGTLAPQVVDGATLCSNNGAIAEVHFTPVAPFSELRGAVSAYVTGDPDAFSPYLSPILQLDIQGRFMDGVAIMLDDQTGYLKHVYSYGVGRLESVATELDSTCPSFGARPPISVIAPNYACALLRSQDLLGSSTPHTYGDLDNDLCSTIPNTCLRPSSWFHRQLANDYYPSNVEIVVRVLSQNPTEILLKHLFLYTR